ncbi:response regulator transcription factor [Caballeronia novacaledonica]|uniref:Response regulator transcription factor n=1 Tax=Caballeronia novacaledonica TaxID=1544861 RepID=A0ACB5QMH0_9BURK|nr:response regulator transcription factor [Caballeronia novacaledonica]
MNNQDLLKVLLLEDEGVQRAGIRALIQMAAPRAQIHEASSYESAISAIQNVSFDIAFLDYDLRGAANGLDVLRKMRELDIDTRAIMLSSYRDRELVLACIDAGAAGFITKEMDATNLFERALETVFMGGVFLPASALGKGGHSPASNVNVQGGDVDSLGIRGRRLEVLYYLCQGLPNKTIARRMGVSEETIRKDYNPALFRVFGVARRTELILEVSRRNIVVPAPRAPDGPQAEH